MRKNSELGNKIIDDIKEKIKVFVENIKRLIILLNISKLQIVMITKFLKGTLEGLKEKTINDENKEEFYNNIQY